MIGGGSAGFGPSPYCKVISQSAPSTNTKKPLYEASYTSCTKYEVLCGLVKADLCALVASQLQYSVVRLFLSNFKLAPFILFTQGFGFHSLLLVILLETIWL